jgi:hypothetical protein
LEISGSGENTKGKKTYGVSTESYCSTLEELLYGLGKGSTSVTDMWGILHGLIMHAVALAFVGILFLSASGHLQHEQTVEGFTDDTGLGTTHPHSTAMTSSSQKELTREEF